MRYLKRRKLWHTGLWPVCYQGWRISSLEKKLMIVRKNWIKVISLLIKNHWVECLFISDKLIEISRSIFIKLIKTIFALFIYSAQGEESTENISGSVTPSETTSILDDTMSMVKNVLQSKETRKIGRSVAEGILTSMVPGSAVVMQLGKHIYHKKKQLDKSHSLQ